MIKNYNTAKKGIGNDFYLLANINLLLEDSKKPQKNHHIEEFNKNVLEKIIYKKLRKYNYCIK